MFVAKSTLHPRLEKGEHIDVFVRKTKKTRWLSLLGVYDDSSRSPRQEVGAAAVRTYLPLARSCFHLCVLIYNLHNVYRIYQRNDPVCIDGCSTIGGQGASRGLGAAIAKDLASTGSSVIVNYAASSGAAEEVWRVDFEYNT